MQAQSSRLGEKESMPLSADDISASHRTATSVGPDRPLRTRWGSSRSWRRASKPNSNRARSRTCGIFTTWCSGTDRYRELLQAQVLNMLPRPLRGSLRQKCPTTAGREPGLWYLDGPLQWLQVLDNLAQFLFG